MTDHMSRRTALAAGAAAAAGTLAIGCSSGEKPATPAESQTPPFLTPWSPDPNTPRDLTVGGTPIRLCSWEGGCTLDYPTDGTSITKMVERIRARGFSAATSYSPMGRKNPWMEAPESEIRELKDACTANDVLFFDVHTVPYLIHPDPAVKEQNIAYVAEQCEAAERVGCPMVTTHLGTKNTVSQVGPHPDNWTMKTWEEGVASLREVLKRTSGMKVKLGIEAVNMTAMNNPRAHRQLMDELGDDRCKVLLDPINMIYIGNYYRTTELINECFDLLGEDILACHAKDTFTIPNQMTMYMTEVGAGKGMLDYELYLASLSRLKWPRPLLIEHLPSAEEYAAAQAFIQSTAARLGVKFV